eukprot:958398-Pelagomonas_calceolata.AAC.1
MQASRPEVSTVPSGALPDVPQKEKPAFVPLAIIAHIEIKWLKRHTLREGRSIPAVILKQKSASGDTFRVVRLSPNQTTKLVYKCMCALVCEQHSWKNICVTYFVAPTVKNFGAQSEGHSASIARAGAEGSGTAIRNRKMTISLQSGVLA